MSQKNSEKAKALAELWVAKWSAALKARGKTVTPEGRESYYKTMLRLAEMKVYRELRK